MDCAKIWQNVLKGCNLDLFVSLEVAWRMETDWITSIDGKKQ